MVMYKYNLGHVFYINCVTDCTKYILQRCNKATLRKLTIQFIDKYHL